MAKVIIEIDLELVERVDDLWKILPETLSELGMEIASAGNLGGPVFAGSSFRGDKTQVGKWELE